MAAYLCKKFHQFSNFKKFTGILNDSVFSHDFLCFLSQLEALESKYIYFPVLPIIEQGEVDIMITAYSIHRTDRESLHVSVSVSTSVLCVFYENT